MDGQSHARPDRDMPFATQPLGCDVTQQDREVRSVTGCYATQTRHNITWSLLGENVLVSYKIHFPLFQKKI
jgi:hypothetical protein